MRLLTVTPNPAVDTTYLLPSLELGGINRVTRALPGPGGKGNNVARVLAALGQTPVATGFAGGQTGAFIEAELERLGIRPAFVAVPGASRICLTIREQATGRVTEIREPGEPVTAADGDRLLARVADLANDTAFAVVSGSLPPGLADDFAAHLVRTLKGRGCFVALDAGGRVLRAGLAGQPDLVKPNREELTDLIGPFRSVEEMTLRVQSDLLGQSLTSEATVLVSLGADGALAIDQDRAIRATPPVIVPVNPVGSGDALLAGYLDALARGLDRPEALRRAVATGTAATLNEGIGAVDLAAIARIVGQVSVDELPRARTVVGSELSAVAIG